MSRKIFAAAALALATFAGVAAYVAADSPAETPLPGVPAGAVKLDMTERTGHRKFRVDPAFVRGAQMPADNPAVATYHYRAEVYDAREPGTPIFVKTEGPFPSAFTPGARLQVNRAVDFNIGPLPPRPEPYTVRVYLMNGSKAAEPIHGGPNERNYGYREDRKVFVR
jgi:hypothetical protein